MPLILARFLKHARWLALAAAVIAAAGVAREWLASRDARVHLEATLGAQKALMDQASAREAERARALEQSLGEIAALKRHVQTPQQVIREIPAYLSREARLPQPIQIQLPDSAPVAQSGTASPTAGATAPSGASSAPGSAIPQSGASAAPNSAAPAIQGGPAIARIPQEDLKPLFDYLEDCRSCKLQLDSARADLTDEHTKIEALTRERDAALRAARGGGFWARAKHAAKWFAIGAVVGAAARAAAH